ncbi:hypothetical protein AWENTII_008744 [Aspergillus wentii]
MGIDEVVALNPPLSPAHYQAMVWNDIPRNEYFQKKRNLKWKVECNCFSLGGSNSGQSVYIASAMKKRLSVMSIGNHLNATRDNIRGGLSGQIGFLLFLRFSLSSGFGSPFFY